MSDAPEVESESSKRPKKPKLETVINCHPAGGHITGMNGNKFPVGDSVELPPEACERLVLAGVARYPARSE